MSLMFKKPKKNFRTRRAKDDSDEEDSNIDSPSVEVERNEPREESIPTKKSKKKKKDRNENMPKSLSTLSFGDEEGGDGEVFQIKKSSHSRRIAKMIKRQHRQEKEEKAKLEPADALASAAGSYSAENMKQLQLEQNSKNGFGPVDMELGSDVEFVSDGDQQDYSEPEDSNGHFSRSNDENDPLAGRDFREMIAKGEIPDANMIHLARKKRQMAREHGDDYISLDDTEKTTDSTSRLIREEDHDCSEDDEGHMEFNVDRREQDLRRMQNTILEAEQGSNSDSSDHDTEWERQQIRKGVSIAVAQVQAGAGTQAELDPATRQHHQYYFGTAPTPVVDVNNLTSAPIVATRSLPPANLPLVTTEIVKKRLEDRLESLQTVHRAHILEKDDITSRMKNCSLDIERLSESKPELEESYKFFQEMRGYVGDLIECLSEKMTSINYLDFCMMNQWQQRADKIVRRRQQDISDQSQEYMPKKPGLIQPVTPEDEARQHRAAEREARRSRRRRAREAQGITDHFDGLSTDDEQNKSENMKLNMEQEHITAQVNTMFDDVVDEFHNLDLIKNRFEEWKYKHTESYQEAYIGLCLPKLFSPFIKLNLITWNPLEDPCVNYEEMDWYESLMFYGYRKGEDPSPNDPDIKLMPSIVEKVLLPKLTAFVETVWDPMSTKQTKRLIKLVRSIVEDYPTISADSKYTQTLITGVYERLKKSLDNDVFMPLYPKNVLENRSSGAYQFFHRQFWSCVKLLGNIFEWQGILSDITLQQLGLACLLNRYMIVALSASPVNAETLHKCNVVISMIPKTWFSSLDSSQTIPLLEPLCRYLVGAATMLERAAPADRECKNIAREGIKQIRKFLVTIHAMDHACTLAEKAGS